jgi:hypothetical protein
MGAWGSGSFENDTAMDWASGVRSVDDVRGPFKRLKRDSDAHGVDPELVVDSDFACELLAAAECVALMLDRKSQDFPDDLAERLADAGEPDNLLFHQARNAVLHVLRNSELAELWEEAAAQAGKNEWLAALTNLIDRLNGDIEIEQDPFAPKDKVKLSPTDVVGTCAFCNGPIQRSELWGMSFWDASDGSGLSKKGLWVHLPCANARMHHKHAIAHMKFDPDNLPDLDQL